MSAALAPRHDIITTSAAAQPISETAAIVQMIERAARDPSVDVDKMLRLLDMREHVDARAAERAFNLAMGQAQAEMPQVVRDAVNDHTKSRYARLETISEKITPVYTKHGFSLSFGTDTSPAAGCHRLTCKVAHRDGHSEPRFADLPSDMAGAQGKANKTAIQGLGSTLSYGRRYLTLLIFNVALTNEDDDGKGSGGTSTHTITEEQAEHIRALLSRPGQNRTRLLEFFRIHEEDELPARRLDEALQMIADRQKTIDARKEQGR